MNNTLFLNENDFVIEKGTRGPVVCCKVPGILFIMFHADPNVCKYCELAKPEFMQLPYIIQGCKFGMCNMSKCMNLMEASKQTISPLVKVPAFLLYVNHKPFMNYDADRTTKGFAEFLSNALNRLKNQQVFSNGSMQTLPSEATERTPYGLAYDYDMVTVTDPTLSGGITCTEEGVCYLTNAEAGVSKKPVQQVQQVQQQAPPPQYLQQPPQQYNPYQVAMTQQMRQPQAPQQQQYITQQMMGYGAPQPQQQYYPQQQQYYPQQQQQQPQQQYYPQQQYQQQRYQ